MKKITALIFFSFLGLCACLFAACKKNDASLQERQKEVVVYAYDSFLGEWGAAEKIAALFEAETGIRATFVDCGDAVEVLARAVLEKNSPKADVILGLDGNLAERARQENILQPHKPQNADAALGKNSTLLGALGGDWLLTPFDYSHFALIYDKASGLEPPRSLSDLTRDTYRRKIILIDPRTSTPGVGFVEWTVAAFGDGYKDFWKKLAPNILTLAPGWSAAWGLFSNGEAPLVISYATSPAASIEYEGLDKHECLVFGEGHVLQVEGAGVLAGAQNEAGARQFVDFLITQKAQEILPLTQWMFPANEAARLPASYASLPQITQAETISADSAKVSQAISEVISILSAGQAK